MILMMMTAFGGNYEILEGTRPANDLIQAVNTRQKTLAMCFKTLPGPAKFHVTVGPDGYVSNAKYSMDGATDPAMLQCINSEALKLRLLPVDDAAPTTYQWMVSMQSIAEQPEREGPKEGEIWVQGVHTQTQVREVLDRNAQAFGFCVRKATVAKIDIPAMVTVRFKISSEGKVTQSTVEKLDANVLTECVAGRVKGLTFAKPPSPGATEVVYPIRLAD